ncbi:MAG: PDZ domain-containing protein, partial [Oscillospiraceae bacterium]|nr:PDZ domain-containing protein [Oscillospiraceae bacterium]
MKKQMRMTVVTAVTAVWLGAAMSVSAWAAQLIPVGTAVGIEVDVDGVLVEKLCEVETDDGAVRPAKAAGLKEGDIILAINGEEVDDLEDFSEELRAHKGETLTLTVMRQGKTFTCELTPVQSKEGEYRLGLWLRDKVAGIGTVTYYDPK